MMRIVLVPVTMHTTAEQHARALAKAIALYRLEKARIHLLCVQAPVSLRISRVLSYSELQEVRMQAAQEALRPAREILSAAGVPFYTHIEIGRGAETIVRISHMFHCDTILIGQSAPEGLAQKLFGTLASQVRHLLSSASGREIIVS